MRPSAQAQVVVTCRTEQYRDAVRPSDGVEVTLRAAAAIQLRPLDADAVRRYLRDDAPGPAARARWAPVLAVLGTQAPAGQALSTPLMVGLARAIYNPRPGELAGTMPDPAELRSFAARIGEGFRAEVNTPRPESPFGYGHAQLIRRHQASSAVNDVDGVRSPQPRLAVICPELSGQRICG
jgi:hypothetical protein